MPFRHSYFRTAAFPATAFPVKAVCARSDDDQNNNAPQSVRSVPVHHRHRFPGNMPDIPEAMQGKAITGFRKTPVPRSVSVSTRQICRTQHCLYRHRSFHRCSHPLVPAALPHDRPQTFRSHPVGIPKARSTAECFPHIRPSTGYCPQPPDLFPFLRKIQTDIPERKAAHRLCVWEVFSSPAYYNPLRS